VKNANKSYLIHKKKEVNKMPAGNRRGPLGQGPRTGRGMGYCAGYPVPGFMSPGPGLGFGRGFGRGFGFGRGRGWRRGGRGFFGGYPYEMPYGYPYSPYPMGSPFPSQEEEKEILKDEADAIEEELAHIKKRLKELEKQDKEKK
jgi:hypothetical protein